MKAALEGVPPAPLPSGVWRSVDQPVADAPPPPPPEPVGEPLAIGRPAQSAEAPAAPGRRPISPAADQDAPLPPAAIPNVGDAPAPHPQRARNFIEKLLGGA